MAQNATPNPFDDPYTRHEAATTYRYLRLGIVAMVLLLAASLVIEIVNAPGCVQTSISAYYHTPVRNVFVGALVAIGFCLIVIRGCSRWQDFFLNVAGMLAPIVALVPTGYSSRCPASNRRSALSPSRGDIGLAGVHNNLLALLIVGLVALAVAWLLRRSAGGGRLDRRLVQNFSLSFVLTVFLVGIGTVLFWTTSWFEEHAHASAAASMFVCLGIVVVIRSQASKDTLYGRIYRVVWIAMAVGAIGCGVLALTKSFAHTIFLVEAIEISAFVAFWITRTIESWALGP